MRLKDKKEFYRLICNADRVLKSEKNWTQGDFEVDGQYCLIGAMLAPELKTNPLLKQALKLTRDKDETLRAGIEGGYFDNSFDYDIDDKQYQEVEFKALYLTDGEWKWMQYHFPTLKQFDSFIEWNDNKSTTYQQVKEVIRAAKTLLKIQVEYAESKAA